MDTELDFKIFKKEDFPEYLSWYQDPELNRRLGPMEEDDEWLQHTLEEQNDPNNHGGCTYSIFQNEKLVSVLGIVYPDQEGPNYGITNIAVKPQLRSKGIGNLVLKKLIQLHPLKEGQVWKAYVDESNPKAKLFFESNGWRCDSESPEHNNMFMLEYRTKSQDL